MLGRGEHRRHDHRARVHRSAFEGVVVILAMGGRAVDERGIVRAERARMADGRGAPVRRGARARRGDIIEPARGDAQPRHVEHQKPDGLARAGGQFRAGRCGGKSRKLL